MYSTYNYPGFELPTVPQPYPYPFHEPDAPVKTRDKGQEKKKPKKPGFNYQDPRLIC